MTSIILILIDLDIELSTDNCIFLFNFLYNFYLKDFKPEYLKDTLSPFLNNKNSNSVVLMNKKSNPVATRILNPIPISLKKKRLTKRNNQPLNRSSFSPRLWIIED